jgi:hypothetical protein
MNIHSLLVSGRFIKRQAITLLLSAEIGSLLFPQEART